jgi:hypothetical protein
MEEGITTKILGPKDCAIGFGIPINKESLDKRLKSDIYREDFYNTFCKVDKRLAYQEYVKQVITTANRVIPQLEKLGVTVETNLTLNKLGTLYNKDISVVILFSHCIDNSIVEFSDVLATSDEIVKQIPDNRCVILDLCV